MLQSVADGDCSNAPELSRAVVEMADGRDAAPHLAVHGKKKSCPASSCPLGDKEMVAGLNFDAVFFTGNESV